MGLTAEQSTRHSGSYKDSILTIVSFRWGKGYWVVNVIERLEGHYEVREAPYGRSYTWSPGHVVVECECGERPTLTFSKHVCRCGVDHTHIVTEELAARRLGEETLHPWRYAEEREEASIPF
jgi:hypothetical protein